MENKLPSCTNFERTPGCVIVQTCDTYQKYWDGFFWSMQKYWDENISWPIYFCNEEIDVACKFKQLKTGKGSHSQRLIRILEQLQDYEYVFYMLEDFWPTAEMSNVLFEKLWNLVKINNWDCLKVAPYMPEYYKLEPTQYPDIKKYSSESDWHFSQQSSFWKRDFIKNCIVEPTISEQLISSSLTGEIASDKFLKEHYPDAKIYHYHYHWYPVSGVLWRGELNQMGEQIEFIRKAEAAYQQI
jgi:hypothetical protein